MRNQNIKADTILDGVGGYELSADSKKMLVNKDGAFYVFDASGSPPNLGESKVNLDGWAFSFDPRDEWRQMFDEAWRLHRDYLYVTNMHGVDWKAMREKYRPLAERATDRGELSDALAQMVGEISLLHTFVRGGDQRPGTDDIGIASLGAEWEADKAGGGYRLDPPVPRRPGRPGENRPSAPPRRRIEGRRCYHPYQWRPRFLRPGRERSAPRSER